MGPRELNGQFGDRVEPRLTLRSILMFLLSLTGMGLLLFIFVINLPENNPTKSWAESSIQWAFQSAEEVVFSILPDGTEQLIQTETTPASVIAEKQTEPIALEDSTSWPLSFDFSFLDHFSPLVDKNPIPRQQVLTDPLNRINNEFDVPDDLKDRTQFWFDIYTKHDSNVHVIHHTRYPWIIFKIIDTRKMITTGKGPLWLRRDRAMKHVSRQKHKIIRTLRKLAKRKNFRRLKGLQKELYETLKKVPGKRRRVLRFASRNIRSQLGQKDFFLQGLKVSSRYLPYMESVFAEQGLPLELTRMPFVESSFNIKARSKVGASGIWQIMPRTGKAYLKVSRTIDERNSPLKATRAAAVMLRQYNRSLKSWPLSITGYNHGIGGVMKAKRIARSKNLATIIRRYHRGSFRFASSNFYTCFLAALYAEKYHDKIFSQVVREKPMDRKIVRLSSRLRLKQVLKWTGLDKKTLIRYNLDLGHSVSRNPWLPRGFELHLPPGVAERVMNKLGKRDLHHKKKEPV